MPVKLEQIQPGAVFRFKNGLRRVTKLVDNFGSPPNVSWEYADGVKRGGKLNGVMWIHHFKAEAIEEVPDPNLSHKAVTLVDGSTVPSVGMNCNIEIKTHCPKKWAFVDTETGEVWGHDGHHFVRADTQFLELTKVATETALSRKLPVAMTAKSPNP